MRYTVPGVPPALACTAFTPHLNRRTVTGWQSYKYAVSGNPGTRLVPAPTTDSAPQVNNASLAAAGSARSTDSPDYWCPQEYYQAFAVEWPGAGMPVRIYDPARPGPTTVLPTPALDLRGLYQRDSARLSANWPQLGQRQIRARARNLKWRDRRG